MADLVLEIIKETEDRVAFRKKLAALILGISEDEKPIPLPGRKTK